jgi:predicted glycogen debranching enzyme
MDAKIGDWVVTPRAGVPVELQALWARGCDTLAAFAAAFGMRDLATRAGEARDRAVAAFRRRFWCEATGYPYDVVSEPSDTGAWQDATIRPNGLMALAVEPRLFDEKQARSILTVVERELLTPVGIRSLSPHAPGYCGRYAGGPRDRDAAYHEGTAWPYLVGFYVRAVRRARPDTPERRAELRTLVHSVAANAIAIGQVPEVADAEPPHRPGGCVAQAWSVAELLRALAWDLA